MPAVLARPPLHGTSSGCSPLSLNFAGTQSAMAAELGNLAAVAAALAPAQGETGAQDLTMSLLVRVWSHCFPPAARTKGTYDLFGKQQLKEGRDGEHALLCSTGDLPQPQRRHADSSTGRGTGPAADRPAAAGGPRREPSRMVPPAPAHAGEEPYEFDPKVGPRAVFERFFGTGNPYEALQGK
jgi:hypothetical protein